MATVTMRSVGGTVAYYVDGQPVTKAVARAAYAATPEGVFAVNGAALLAKATDALAANQARQSALATLTAGVDTFLAIATPTTAQRNQFIRDLGTGLKMLAADTGTQYRQISTLIRLAANQLADTTGT